MLEHQAVITSRDETAIVSRECQDSRLGANSMSTNTRLSSNPHCNVDSNYPNPGKICNVVSSLRLVDLSATVRLVFAAIQTSYIHHGEFAGPAVPNAEQRQAGGD
jgi:hypothetical protein